MKTAEENFAEFIMEGASPEMRALSDQLNQGPPVEEIPFIHAVWTKPVEAYSRYSARATSPKSSEVEEVALQPFKAPLRGRLDRQAKEVRKRLNNPGAVMLVLRGKTYTAGSVWGVVWLYLKTKLFKRWTRKHYPSLAT